MKANLEAKIEKLEEEYVDATIWMECNKSLYERGLDSDRRRGSGLGYGFGRGQRAQPYRRPVLISGPCIVYMLKDEEILEDWMAIKKSTLLKEIRNTRLQNEPPK